MIYAKDLYIEEATTLEKSCGAQIKSEKDAKDEMTKRQAEKRKNAEEDLNKKSDEEIEKDKRVWEEL